jgi:hypothetical protein
MRALSALFAVVSVIVFASWARASEASKPTVCVSFAIAKTDKANDDAVAICYDGKKPALFYRFEVVEVPGKEAGRVKVLVGWR